MTVPLRSLAKRERGNGVQKKGAVKLTEPFADGQIGSEDILVAEKEDVSDVHVVCGHIYGAQVHVALRGLNGDTTATQQPTVNFSQRFSATKKLEKSLYKALDACDVLHACSCLSITYAEQTVHSMQSSCWLLY